MKRTLALLLTFALILTTFTGCIKKKQDAKKEDTSEYEALYAPVLKKYKQAIDENWSAEKFADNDLSPNLANLDEKADAGFAFLDLNGDKTPELFIGRGGNDGVADDLYTVTGEGIQQIAKSDGSKTITLGNDGRIFTEEPNEAGKTVTTVGTVQEGKINPSGTYLHDPQKTIDGEHEWFEENPSGNRTPISQEEYTEKTTHSPKQVASKPFDELDEKRLAASPNREVLPVSEPSESTPDYEALYAPVLEKYRTAVDEKWSYEQCEENGLANNCWDEWYDEDRDELHSEYKPGYAYHDLDSDGQPELLIGNPDYPATVSGIYTIRDGKAVNALKDAEELFFMIYSSGDIQVQAADAPFSIYRIKNGTAQFIAGYVPYQDVYYKTTDENTFENIDYANYRNTWQRVSESEVAQWNYNDALTFDFIPFGSNVDGQSTTIRDCYRDVLDDCAQDADFYTVYDIDNDGVPELIILMGHYEAEYYYEVYSYDDTEKSAESAGTFEGGHVGLYGIPGENGMYAQQAFQGNETIFLITMQNGEIKQETVSTQNIGNGEYTELDHYIETSYLQEDFEYSLLKTIK